MNAGGSFAPWTPSQPLSRMEFLVKEVGAHFMLYSEERLGRCPGFVEKAIAVGPSMTESATPRHRLMPVGQSNAAHVFFTSGSTRTPKGFVVEHRAFSSGAIAHENELQMDRRVLYHC